MSGGGYVPANSAVEGDYHNPYDHHQRFAGLEALGQAGNHTANDTDGGGNHYEAPSCLVRNPSGSLFIPSTGTYVLYLHDFVTVLTSIRKSTFIERMKDSSPVFARNLG